MARPAAVAVVSSLMLFVGVHAITSPPAAASVSYRWPVVGRIVDPFRPPLTRFGPGNRGVEFATDPGAVVWSSAEGVVTFAGSVGGELFVVVRHADGIRTTYGLLASIAVQAGELVGAGERLGTSNGRVYFGARYGNRYLDPARLIAGSWFHARLVPLRSWLVPALRAAAARAFVVGAAT